MKSTPISAKVASNKVNICIVSMSVSWFYCFMRFVQDSDTMGVGVEVHVALCTFRRFCTFLKVKNFKCNFINSLRISYMQTMYFEHIQPHCSP